VASAATSPSAGTHATVTVGAPLEMPSVTDKVSALGFNATGTMMVDRWFMEAT
jgi:hypothetical protein